MWKRIFGVLSFVGAALWPLLWEFVRSLFYERGSHMLAPFIDSITLEQIVHWGPTVGLTFLGLWLFWKTRPEETAPEGELIGNPTSNLVESSPIPSGTIASPDYRWQFDSRMACEIAARLRRRPEWQDKIIVDDVTPEYLWGLFHGRTSKDGDNLAKSFLNKWMVVCGPFGDVSSPFGKQMLVTFAFRNSTELVFMYFNEEWHDRLGIIIQNKKIAVIGRIHIVRTTMLQLEDCELVQ